MIFADKVINERKRMGWSQDELAERPNVSRQAVSKWESARAVPDIGRIIAMAELFGVSIDYLLKDEMEREEYVPAASPEEDGKERLRKVTLAEAHAYLDYERESAPRVALGVALCILSPIVLILLEAFSETGRISLSENAAFGIGVTLLLLHVAAAVWIFLNEAGKGEPFEFLDHEVFETEYGVDGFAKDSRSAYRETGSSRITLGVILCVLSPVPLFVAGSLFSGDAPGAVAVAVLLLLVSAGVYLIVDAAVIKGSFEKILQEGDYTPKEKRRSRHLGTASGIYWTVMTALFLFISFYTDSWTHSWILWPVAGVLFAPFCAVVKALTKQKPE